PGLPWPCGRSRRCGGGAGGSSTVVYVTRSTHSRPRSVSAPRARLAGPTTSPPPPPAAWPRPGGPLRSACRAWAAHAQRRGARARGLFRGGPVGPVLPGPARLPPAGALAGRPAPARAGVGGRRLGRAALGRQPPLPGGPRPARAAPAGADRVVARGLARPAVP